MPECQSCGNTTAFVHEVEGEQVRIYDEHGDYIETENERLETRLLWCDECKSEDVRWVNDD